MAEKRMHISPDLSLSINAVTNTELLLARRRVGKTYTGSVYAEELIKAGLPFVAQDPTGAWWGLGSSADGKQEGYPVIVIGGHHGHLPLEARAGKVIANMIADNPGFYIIDYSLMDDEKDQHIFSATFARQIFKRHKQKPFTLKLIIDEADMFVPQKPVSKEHIECFRAYDAIVRRGGLHGLGVMMISQRPALVNTDVRTQCETLIALQTSAPLDQDPILDWVSRNGTKEQLEKIRATLASLKTGQAWYFSPNDDVFKMIQIRERETFNSSATPKPGAKPIEAKVFSRIDLDKLGEEIKATVERTKREDPDYWRRQNQTLQNTIDELQRKLEIESRTLPVEAAAPRIVEKYIFKPGEYDSLNKGLIRLEEIASKLIDQQMSIHEMAIKQVRDASAMIIAGLKKPAQTLETINSRIVITPKNEQPLIKEKEAVVSIPEKRWSDWAKLTTRVEQLLADGLTRPQQKIIDAIAWMETVGIRNPQRSVIAALAGYSMRSSTFTNPLGNLRSMGLLVYPDSNTAALTDEGRKKANQQPSMATTRELHQAVMNNLNGPQQRILQVLIDAYPAAVDREELAQKAGYSVTSSTFTNPLGNLRSFGFIDYPNARQAIALPILFIDR